MRRVAAILTSLIALGAFQNVAAAEPTDGPFHSLFESADASWFVREQGKPYMYVGGAYRTTDATGGVHAYGFASRIKCWEKRTKHFGITICFGSVRGRKIASEKFTFDPLLNDTSVSFDGNKIAWQGRGDYYPDAYPIADAGFGAMVYGSLDREARAKGKIMGMDFTTKGWKDWGYLSEGVFGGVITTERGTVRYSDDGTVTYRLRFRTPR